MSAPGRWRQAWGGGRIPTVLDLGLIMLEVAHDLDDRHARFSFTATSPGGVGLARREAARRYHHREDAQAAAERWADAALRRALRRLEIAAFRRSRPAPEPIKGRDVPRGAR